MLSNRDDGLIKLLEENFSVVLIEIKGKPMATNG